MSQGVVERQARLVGASSDRVATGQMRGCPFTPGAPARELSRVIISAGNSYMICRPSEGARRSSFARSYLKPRNGL
jgi:hypothetical protein